MSEAASPELQAKAPAARFDWLDILRVAAIFDIVGVHVGRVVETDAGFVLHKAHPLLGMGLPVFLLCSIALGARRSPPRPFAEHARRRWSRLMLPYLAWSVLYLVYNTIQFNITGDWQFARWGQWNGWFLFVGTDYPLWYLSFILVAEIITNGIQQLTDRWAARKPGPAFLVWLAIGCAGVALLPQFTAYVDVTQMNEAKKHALTSWYRAAAVIPLGIALAVAMRRLPGVAWPVVVLTVVGAFMWARSGPIAELVPWTVDTYWTRRFGLCLVLIGLALSVPLRAPKVLMYLSTLTFGVYLVHVMLIWPVQLFVPGPTWVPRYVIVWVLSLGVAVLMKKTPGLRRVV